MGGTFHDFIVTGLEDEEIAQAGNEDTMYDGLCHKAVDEYLEPGKFPGPQALLYSP